MTEPFASFGSLGSLKSQHSISKRSRNTMLTLGVIWAIMLCADIVVSISVFITSYQETNNALSALVVPLICVGIFALPGFLIAYQQWWTGVFGVAFYDLGISIRTRRGIKEIQWRDIESLRLEWAQSGNPRYSTATTLAAYAFCTKGGETFRLRSNLEGFSEFEEKFYKPVMLVIEQDQKK